ncbi:hypothetical protein WDW89_26035 [Deltaproteobacteria bacterium TL4]
MFHQKILCCFDIKAWFKKVRQELKFWQEALLQQRGNEEYERLTRLVEQSLDELLRSSSIVETTNSKIRPLLDSARRQVTQERLNLIRFYLNHKSFERSRRAGSTADSLWNPLFTRTSIWTLK